jgi:glycosyltransferase involved in cell wall biosynthesis
MDLPLIYVLDASVDVTGAFVCVRNLARSLSGLARVVLVLPGESRIPPTECVDFEQVVRLPIVSLSRSATSMLKYGPALAVSSWELLKGMREKQVSRLLVNDFNLMHGLILRMLGYRGILVTWIRFDPRRFGTILSTIWLRGVSASSTEVVAVSRYVQSIVPRWLHTRLIYDAVPFMRPDLSAFSVKDTRNHFVFVGNYIEGKGQSDALVAFSRIADRHPSLDLHFYGSDMGLQKNRAYRRQLEELATRLGLSERVKFLPFAPDTSRIFRQSVAALNFSVSETFSMTCLEASASGVPVIATRSGGPQEIIVDGVTGFLVPVRDIEAMAVAMDRLAAEPHLSATMGDNGLSLVRERFSNEAYVRAVRHVFRLGD